MSRSQTAVLIWCDFCPASVELDEGTAARAGWDAGRTNKGMLHACPERACQLRFAAWRLGLPTDVGDGYEEPL